ncbi:tRNA (adenosine(37)-N6)-threonylcarbamoyltransferase complex dimerization subunit type 1 TsaB [Haliovirga abyssi]|uniref:tRNA (Adenosine(37)-N6)-threonylcarbamoyltransferase complex dimerization subunit type 1 TsaB n=1 Tax=Haliovirga abyssi TaxID=2996794 RepID=A0AAU9E2Z4_9FUSO|nr:tRNA (adenosine(37)-N6)-threonylcarbamoyltransferase complex dimerization subunit type 1 TsaB [Haliovirga abyssi]BDU50790.1 tRNA (adenosine(37)-N6)-threonylcarbamoyltransferase complex dimerization subunit type 1 TsaB [Haliovirga abyssi]
MLILGIDTSTKISSVALYDSENGIISKLDLEVKFNHSDSLLKGIDTLFEFSKLKISDVDRVAVGIGPGSFTGVRVGIGTAKGIAFAIDKEIIGINSLEILANGISDSSDLIIPMIDARKERVYYGVYKYVDSKLKVVEQIRDGKVLDILEKYKDSKKILTGDGSINYRELILENGIKNIKFNKISRSKIDAGVLCEIAEKKEDDNIYLLEPEYISKSQAERQKEKIKIEV